MGIRQLGKSVSVQPDGGKRRRWISRSSRSGGERRRHATCLISVKLFSVPPSHKRGGMTGTANGGRPGDCNFVQRLIWPLVHSRGLSRGLCQGRVKEGGFAAEWRAERPIVAKVNKGD